MANQRTYSITINGITESVNAVNALNESLKTLESRINALSNKAVNVSASSGGGSKSSSTSSLSEEEKLQKQINQLEEKRIAHSKEIYQNYLAAKDVLKEVENDQKQIAAQERLTSKSYSNTIDGMKQELADIKAVMQTVDLGDTDQMDKMIQRANDLNSKLKEIEQSYGQFGRNVGNYASAFDGMQKLSINVGGVTREFNSAREASKTLKNELIGLEAAGSGNTEVAKQLRSEYYKLQSAMDDATKSSKAMDAAMDTMQSFTAMASVGQGLKGFFGFDDNEIQRSIQRLVALQNVLKGIETIRKQIETGEGIGGAFKKSYAAIDTATQKLLVYNRALLGTGTAAKVASVGISALSTAAKALASIGIVAIISAAVWAIQKAVEAVRDWAKGNADLVTSEQRLKYALDATNDALERNLKLNQAKYDAQKINAAQKQIEDEKAYAQAIKESNDEIERRMKINPNNSTFSNYASGKKGNADVYADNGVTTLGGFTEAIGDADELVKRYNALSKAVEENTGLVYKNAKGYEIAHLTASDVKDELNHLEQMLAGRMVNAMKSFDLSTEEGRKGLQKFVTDIQNSDSELYKSILVRLPEIIDNEKGALGDALGNWLSLIKQFVASSNAALNALDFEKYVNSILDAADKTGERAYQRQKAELKARYDALSKDEQKAQKENFDNANAALDKMHKERLKKTTDQINARGKREAAEIEAAEKYKNELTIKLMRDGLAKILRQIDEEERAELVKAKKYGADVLKVQQYYDRRRLEEKRRWAQEVKETYLNLYNDLRSLISENENNLFENTNAKIQNELQSNVEKELGILAHAYSRNYSNYGSVKDITKRQPSTFDYSAFSEDEIKKAKELLDIQNKLILAEIDYNNLIEKLPKEQEKWNEEQLMSYNIAKKRLDILNEEGKKLLKQTNEYLLLKLWDDSYSKSLTDAFNTRIRERELYYNNVKKLNEKAQKEELEELKRHNDELRRQEIEDAGQRYVAKNSQTVSDKVVEISGLGTEEDRAKALDELFKDITETTGKYFGENGELAQALREGKLTIDQFYTLSLNEAQQYREKLKLINEKYDQEEKSLQNQTNQELRTINSAYYSQIISEFSEFSQELNNRYGRQPILNNFNIVDISKTNKNLKEVKSGFIVLLNEILAQKAKLQASLDNNEISFDDFKLASSQLNDLEIKVNETIKGVEEKLKDLPGEFIASINTYIQYGLQSLQTIMNAFDEYQDYKFDKEQDALDKENEMLEKQLDKQRNIIENHKNAVESIEEELADSRGDRRQHLIDQLNAEMQAQRAAQAEEQRIQKQKEATEKRQEALEKKRKQAEYKRNLLSILVSTAMATANGLATQPFVPVGIAMGALATTLGMIQYALAAKAKPYAKGGQLDGGVAQGNRHRDGGIKVLGGRAEIEGGEFITNRITTQMNAPLLEFINSRKKRIDVSDLIDFYSSGKVKKNIMKMSPKNVFEDGGYIPPTLSNNIEIDDRLLESFEKYSNRPIYVSVVDISNKQEQIRQVQALAGIH